MINDMFKEVFELSKQLQEKNYKKDFTKISEIDKNIGTFEEYVNREKEELNKEIPVEKKKIIEDAYILKDTISKESLKFDLYLFRLKHIEPLEFDENYKIKPLKETQIFEYGAVISLEDESGYYNISGTFGGVEDTEQIARDKYRALKIKIEKSSSEELLGEIKKDILKQINE